MPCCVIREVKACRSHPYPPRPLSRRMHPATRRVPRRVRVAQGLGLLCVAVLAAALIGHSLSAALNQARGIASTSTPAPLGPVLVLSNVSYGALTLNGAPLAGPPPVLVTFRRGV